MDTTTPPPHPRLLQLLSGADESTLRELFRIVRYVRFGRADPLIRQGDRLAVLIVLKGHVSARRMSAEGRRYTTLLLRPGHVIGLGSVVRATDAAGDLVGLSEGIAAILPGAALRRLAAGDPGLALRLFDLGSGFLDVMTERLDQATFDSAERRVATILLSYEDLLCEATPVITRSEFASLAGTSREMLGVVIRALEAEGVIHRQGRAIVIDDRTRLHEIAAWDSCGAEHVRALTVPALTAFQPSRQALAG